MDEILQIECRNGPLDEEARGMLRFGGKVPYQRARALATIRQLTRACMEAIDAAAFRSLYEMQRNWRRYLATLD